MITQATIWSGRAHCEAAVVKSLRWLDGVDARLWMVHDPAQLARLRRARVPGVQFLQAEGVPVPQYAPEADKRRACLHAWSQLWRTLAGVDGDVLLVDDDCEVPMDAVRRLSAHAEQAWAVSGLTRNNRGAWPMFGFGGGQATAAPVEPGRVDMVGTFCFYLTARAIAAMRNDGYNPALDVPGTELKGHDLHLCWWLWQDGGSVWVDPSVRCNHHVMLGPDEYVIRMGAR